MSIVQAGKALQRIIKFILMLMTCRLYEDTSCPSFVIQLKPAPSPPYICPGLLGKYPSVSNVGVPLPFLMSLFDQS